MKCGRAEELFSDYLDGSLPIPLRKDLDEHLESCPRCHPMMRSYREILETLRSMPRPRPSPDLAERILAATRSRFPLQRNVLSFPGLDLPRRIQWALWGAAAAFVLFALVRPPNAVHSLGNRVTRLARQTYSHGLRVYRGSERLIDELNVLRMTVGVAFEDRLDRLNERLKDLEEARRKSDSPPKDSSTLTPIRELTENSILAMPRSLI